MFFFLCLGMISCLGVMVWILFLTDVAVVIQQRRNGERAVGLPA
ncbi:hypothetical protein [Streptomyces sp. BE303]|nr:hypothetical protein [Streptomyces sp. BE303]MED7952407.1 hypothetical protein [Streptomyces sp. BE303]